MSQTFNAASLQISSTERQFESGLICDVTARVRAALMAPIKKEIKIYEELESYVSDRLKEVSPNLEFQNVKVLFICFSGFLALFLFLFLLQHLVIPAIKKRHKLTLLRRRRIERTKRREAVALANQSSRPKTSRNLESMSLEHTLDPIN